MDMDKVFLPDSIDERIESFLRGTMTEEEEAAFKQEIRTNPELRSRAKTMAALIRGFQETEGEREAKLIGSGTQERRAVARVADKEELSQGNIRKIVRWACSIAAVFLIFISVYSERQAREMEEMLSPYYSAYSDTDISRGEVDSVVVTHLYDIFRKIPAQRNMSAIIQELEPIYDSLDSDYTFYPFANDIAWNLALAYIKDHQIDKALVILDKLKNDNPETPISAKADELMKRLKER